jgi:putative ABC transport system permease protein
MTDIISVNVAQRRFSLILLALFAGLAMFLAALGLYAVMSYVVAQRTAEIGIRMALGAQPAQVLRLVQRQGMLLVLTGLALGIGGGLLLTRWMASMLFHVQPADPLALIAGSATLVAVCWLASYFPARRAARVDPLIALRFE